MVLGRFTLPGGFIMSSLLKNLLAKPVSEEELLAVGDQRDTGTLARLSRHQLIQLCEEGKLAETSVEGISLPTENVLQIARFTVGLALFKRNINTTKVDVANRIVKYKKSVAFILENHQLRLKSAATKSAKNAQRRANTMAEVTEIVKGSKAAGKSPAKAAKKAPAKEAKKTAEPGDADETVSRYATDMRKIKVVNKENPHREGSARANAFDAVITSKTVADYAATGNKPKYLDKWVDSGNIELIG
jgi:hypothetical protein